MYHTLGSLLRTSTFLLLEKKMWNFDYDVSKKSTTKVLQHNNNI